MAEKDAKGVNKEDKPPIEPPQEDDTEFTRRMLRETHAQQIQQTQMLTKVASSLESLTSLLLMSNVFPREATVLLDQGPSTLLTENRAPPTANAQGREQQPPTAAQAATAANIQDGHANAARQGMYTGIGARPKDNSTAFQQPLRG